MIGAAAIGGLLLIFQIRTVNDAVNSAKAIFAADTGIELVTWCAFKGCDAVLGEDYDAEKPPPIVFEDSSVSFDTDHETSGSAISITSRGRSGNAIRTLNSVFIFELPLDPDPPTAPGGLTASPV